jgi:hypothetical protein
MRILFAAVLLGCQGEKVIDIASDAAVDGAIADANPFTAACAPNLIKNGDFAMASGGWKNNNMNVTPIDGPCGRAVRLTAIGPYPELGQDVVGAPFKKGTRYHLRVLFRDVGRETGNRPGVIARFFHHDDAGAEVYTQTLLAQAYSADGFHLAEIAEPLERDEERLGVTILSENALGDSFDVGAVSLVVE